MKQYNDRFACTFRTHSTEGTDYGGKYPVEYPLPDRRTDEELHALMVQAAKNGGDDDIFGVKGISALINLNNLSLVDNPVPDYLHAALLGAINQHTEFLFSNTQEPYYIGTPVQLAEINDRLTLI